MSGNISKVFHDINTRQPPSYWDYENYKIKWGDHEKYQLIRKIGKGKYSEVYEGLETSSGKRVCVKVLKPIMKTKIKREISVLENLSGGPNVVKLIDIVRDPKTDSPGIVTEYIDNVDFRFLYPTFTEEDIKYYSYEILKCLYYSHSKGIIHRDIKPHNVMIDHSQRKLRIIDWGLGEYYHPGKEYSVRVASRFFKGPELLAELHDYDYSLDLWSFGCLLACMIFRKHPMFHGKDNEDQLVKICEVLGTKDLYKYMAKYNLTLDSDYDGLLYEDKYQKQDLWKLKNQDNAHLMTPDSMDFIQKLLVIDHGKRLTAREAMMHPYFDSIRREMNNDEEEFFIKESSPSKRTGGEKQDYC